MKVVRIREGESVDGHGSGGRADERDSLEMPSNNGKASEH